MILKHLARIHSKGTILKIGDREIPFETRLEYAEEDDERPAPERVITPDGREFRHDTEFLEEFGRSANASTVEAKTRCLRQLLFCADGKPHGEAVGKLVLPHSAPLTPPSGAQFFPLANLRRDTRNAASIRWVRNNEANETGLAAIGFG